MRYLLCAAGLLAAALTAGCKPREFVCTANNQCTASNGGYGLCVADHCAFSDPSCASHWRWDDTAGMVGDECVPPEALIPDAGVQADGGLPDATAADAGAADAGGGSADAGPADAAPVD